MGESSLKQKRRGMFAERVSGRDWSGCCPGNRKEEKMDKTEKQTFYRKLMGLVLPIALQQFLLACVSAADALMLGYLDQDAMSAVSLAGQVTFVFNLFVAALTIGGSMFAAQYWGKGEKSMVEEILGLILRVALLVSFLFTAAALFVPELLMEFFTKEPALIVYGAQYLRIVSPSYLLCGASQMYLCIMKNSGRAFQSTVISGTMEAADIVMNLVLIYGLFGMPKMGVAGAALSTVVAKAVELLWAMADSRPSGRIHLRLSCLLHPDGELRRRFWKYTTPVLGNELVWGCGFAMYSVIMGHLGSDAVAANSVANVVKNLVVCVCLGIGTGGGVLQRGLVELLHARGQQGLFHGRQGGGLHVLLRTLEQIRAPQAARLHLGKKFLVIHDFLPGGYSSRPVSQVLTSKRLPENCRVTAPQSPVQYSAVPGRRSASFARSRFRPAETSATSGATICAKAEPVLSACP